MQQDLFCDFESLHFKLIAKDEMELTLKAILKSQIFSFKKY